MTDVNSGLIIIMKNRRFSCIANDKVLLERFILDDDLKGNEKGRVKDLNRVNVTLNKETKIKTDHITFNNCTIIMNAPLTLEGNNALFMQSTITANNLEVPAISINGTNQANIVNNAIINQDPNNNQDSNRVP